MSLRRRERRVIAAAGAAALVAVGLNLAFSAVAAHRRRKRRELPGFTAQVNLSAADIKRLADRVVSKSKETYDAVAAVPLDKVSFSNVIAPLAELDAQQFPLVQACVLPRMVSPSDDVRRASAEAEKRLDSHFQQCSYRSKLKVREFERNGAKLTQSKKTEMEKLKSHIDDLSLKYIQSLNDSTKFLLLNEEDLAGMPLEFLKVGSTRKLIAVAYGQKGGKENIAILEKLVQLRHRLARLLGYPNYADYAIEPRMPRTSRKMEEEGDAQFSVEDLLYYMKRAEELKVDLDIGEIKQFFPVDLVISGILKMFQDLFALRFEEMKDAETWHDTVRLFSVWDASSSDLLGYFFLDIFSREGKYAHTCVVALQNRCLCSNGTRKVPVAVLLSQCPKEFDGNSALLRFPEVVRIFHEFSHVVHHISNRATFSRFSGLQLEGDFAEIPSLLLENWCYENISLKMMSGFHQDITKSITSEACQSLKRRRDIFAGLKLKQEILLCLVDQIIHTGENVNIDDLIKDLHPKVMLGIPLLEGNSPASCFPRIAIGYDAVCYSYIWSEVFAADLFASKFKDDLLNQHAGLRFRNKVLAPGGSKNPLDIISDYLGREPSLQAFIQSRTRNSL
ncbi:endopeptidase-like protein [Oryza sativa Japonica Group]|uniref:Endopeptidase-like protein n=1 Tax=Oryza sativa subsp. japonica TaxID=39947 RepID=Q8RZ80_ORYSJ|nr:endopeptidase-like protein [Oryza sativa Japonica Group]